MPLKGSAHITSIAEIIGKAIQVDLVPFKYLSDAEILCKPSKVSACSTQDNIEDDSFTDCFSGELYLSQKALLE